MEYWIMPVIWGVLCLGFSIVEAATVTMVSCWFAIGSLIALIGSLFGVPMLVQIVLFILGTLLSFILIHRKVFQIFQFEHSADGAEQYLGKTAIVTEAITPNKDGRISIDGRDWKASGAVYLDKGSRVRTIGLQGVTIKVEPLDSCAKKQPPLPL